MNNDNKEIIDSTNDEKEVEVETVEETQEETDTESIEKKAEKPSETLEARKARLERQLAQTYKKLGLDKPEKKEVESSNSNDLGEKAFLIANGIKGADEISLAKKLAKETGKDIENLLETTYFQTELKNLREEKTTANAIPGKGKRAGNSSVDSVEYWIAKGELPPTSETKLRQDVVNARMKKETAKGQFYNS